MVPGGKTCCTNTAGSRRTFVSYAIKKAVSWFGWHEIKSTIPEDLFHKHKRRSSNGQREVGCQDLVH